MSESKVPESLEKLSDMQLMEHYRVSALLPNLGAIHYIAAIIVLAVGGYEVMAADPKDPWMSVLVVAVIPYVLLLAVAYVYRNIRTRGSQLFFRIYSLLLTLVGLYNAGLGTYEYCNVAELPENFNTLWLTYGIIGWWLASLLMIAVGILSWRGSSDEMLFSPERRFSAAQIAFAWKKRRHGEVVPDSELPKYEKAGSLSKYALVLSYVFIVVAVVELSPIGTREDFLRPDPLKLDVYVPEETILLADNAFKQENFAEALKHYRVCARNGEIAATLQLGKMYHNGLGVKRNIPVAVSFYQLVAEEGIPEAQMMLARMYENGVIDEEKGGKVVVKQDSPKAIYWYGSAAEQNTPEAAAGRDRVLAAFKAKAEGGDTDAAIALARIYLIGYGIEANDETAGKFFELAATQPEGAGIYAMLRIAEIFEKGEKNDDGKVLIQANKKRAYDWYARAAESKNDDAVKAFEKFKKNNDMTSVVE